jgi:hypothetical protein
MMQVSNEWFYENLDEQNTIKLLDDMKAGAKLTPGPQIKNLVDCEGPEGQTSLHDPSKIKNISRDFAALKKELAAEAAAAEKEAN